MSTSGQPLRLEKSDLYSPQVEAYLQDQESLRRPMPEVEPQPLIIRVIYSSYFYLSIAAGLGALCGWATLEPFFDDKEIHERFDLVAVLIFPVVAGSLGFFLGAVEGLMCRNMTRALICAVVGLGVGLGGGLISIFAAGLIFAIMNIVAIQFWKNPQPNQMPGGLALLILMMGRAAAWAVAAIPAGIGQGIALREKKVILNGLLGAVLGGLLGGLLFDPISLVFITPDGKATVSRGVGFAVIGILVGLFVGLVEQWTKTAWLLMKAGQRTSIYSRTPRSSRDTRSFTIEADDLRSRTAKRQTEPM
jgi:hypothetical protein